MRISPIEYKSQIRDSINSIFTVEFEIIRRILPIFIGVYKALYFKYQGNSILSTHERIFLNCFETNLPGIGPEHKKISRQTFDQIFLHELKMENEIFCNWASKASLESSQALIDQDGKVTKLPTNYLKSSKQNFTTDNFSAKQVSDKHGPINMASNSHTKKIDFYNNSIIISGSSNWDKKQKKLYLGLFNPKIQFINGDHLNKNAQSYQLGNNWSTISAKKSYNYLSCLKLTDQIEQKNKLGKKQQNQALKFKTIHTNTLNTTYLNLDELPIKLNSSYSLDPQKNSNLPLSLESLPNDFLMNDILASKPTINKSTISLKQAKSTKQEQKTFNALKIRNVGDFFGKNNKQKKTVNRILKNLELAPHTFLTETQGNNLQGIIQKKSLNNKNIPLPASNANKNASFFTDKKSQYFDHFIKQYGSNKNITCLPTYEISDTSFQNIGNNKSKILQLKRKKVYLSQLTSSKKALKLLKTLEKFISIEKNTAISPRLMSGYIIPDLSNKSTLLHLKKNNARKPHSLKLKNKTLFYFFTKQAKSRGPIVEIPNNFFPYQTGLKVDLTDGNIHSNLMSEESKSTLKQRTVYEGPLIFQNKITHEVEITNAEKVKGFYRQLISSDNPLTDQQQNFFGNSFLKTKSMVKEFESNFVPEISIKKPLFIKKKYIRKFTTGLSPKWELRILAPGTRAVIKEMVVPSPNKLILTKRFRYLAYLNQLEWDEFAAKLKTRQKVKTDNQFAIKTKLTDTKKIDQKVIHQTDAEKQKGFFAISQEVGLISKKVLPFIPVYQATGKIVSWPLNQIDFTSNQAKANLQYFDGLQQKKQIESSLSKKENEVFYKAGSGEKEKTFYKQFQSSQVGMTLSKTGTVRLEKQVFGKTYKRTNTAYTNKNLVKKPSLSQKDNNGSLFEKSVKQQTPLLRHIFYQPFEPMTYASFLYVSQRYSILIFFIYIFKDILKKYQQEIKSFILGFMNSKDSSNENEAYNLHQNFRIVKNIKKNFDNIGGIDAILPELGEIVWFLRNSAESLSFYEKQAQHTISQAILLTGPPGTGKTLLVQAIAGEAKVPVLIESASSLMQPNQSFSGTERIKNLFEKAREIAPCIIFIDEIDTFAEKRTVMMENPIFHDPILDSIYPSSQKHKNNSANQNSKQLESSLKQNKGNLLRQLLIELDGVISNKKVLVFAATNRPQILDSALIRPGRFNKTLDLKLPNKQKRIEIIKLYSDNMGVEKNISLDYIANLTIGLSAADLASAINQSSIQAIQSETIHTIETLEYGIHSITGYTTQKNKLRSFVKKGSLPKTTNLFLINRLAYYQAGKIVVHTLLKTHPNIIAVHLWPEVKSPRHHLIHNIREKQFSQIYRRVQLESRIIGFYAGKAGELIGLFKELFFNKKSNTQGKPTISFYLRSSEDRPGDLNSSTFSRPSLAVLQSDLGIQDMNSASWLGEIMVNKWYLYSKKISIENFNRLKVNYNTEQNANGAIADLLQKKSFAFHSLYQNLQNNSKEVNNVLSTSTKSVKYLWLQKQVAKKFEFLYSNKTDWYRIYSVDHKQDENTRYVSPDIYYHSNIYLKKLNKYKFINTKILVNNKFSSIVNWNEIYPINRDYIYQSLLATCFNKSLSIIDQNRELLDLFATSLLRKEILREYEIHNIIQEFFRNRVNDIGSLDPEISLVSVPNKNMNFDKVINKNSQQNLKNKIPPEITKTEKLNEFYDEKKFQKIQNTWGEKSHRKLCKFINFKNLKGSTEK